MRGVDVLRRCRRSDRVTQIRWTLVQFHHIGDELVAVARNSDDVLVFARPFVKRLPQSRNVSRQGVFADGCVRPDLSEQFFFRDHSGPVVKQLGENLERFRCERDDGPVSPEQTFAGIHDEGTKPKTARIG